jgi:hypothetical protein
MKKYFIIALLSIAGISALHAQDYKVNQTSGKLVLNLGSVTVEGYNGNDIVFSSSRDESEKDPRAKGLRAINGSGYVDNTGLGISVEQKGTTTEVNQIATSDLSIKVMVPKGVIVSLACHRVSNAGTILFKNMENEIEISTDYNKIELEDITGPATVRALYGSVDATFTDNIKGPISIASIYSTVDVSIPTTTKANIKLNTSHGEILASADLKIELEKTDGEMINYGRVQGKLNGGGAELKLTSEYSKIYLRKNK